MALNELQEGLTDALMTSSFDVHVRAKDVPHAPNRAIDNLSVVEYKLALKNALRYIPKKYHPTLAQEFMEELSLYGHIYMYRFRPTSYEMKAYPIDQYPAKCKQGAALMLMIMNNLDKRVAQFPHELVTYGGNGSVFSNWAQYRLVMKYLSEMTENQTLPMYSGHPLGLFPSHPDAPRVVVTNGMTIPNYSTREDYNRMYALGVTQYGQMTAGSYCYIGPQGIVHGTTITLMNAARKYLNAKSHDDMRGLVYVTSGLGGMSGAQPKAGVISGMIAVVAEVDEAALTKRYEQGWIQEKETDIEKIVERIKRAKKEKKPLSIGFLGNIVTVWERLAKEKEHLVDLGSDQTSLHNPFNGGYYPVDVSVEEAKKMMINDPAGFKEKVHASLRRQVTAINTLVKRGMRFWDYGNAFLLEAGRAGAEIWKDEKEKLYRYPSYVEDIMGDIFSLGFGPFRWVCTSGNHSDLMETDKLAAEVIGKLSAVKSLDERVKQQYSDNHEWIRAVESHKLVVGSEARILYSNSEGRVAIAEAFNKAVHAGKLKGPVMLSRDHHDVSGTDSPYRETSNIRDGSRFTADMAIQNVIGDAFRGATSVSIHNGGGTGWGEAMNGGFLLLLDGSQAALTRSQRMLFWDVNNGVGRRAWSGNANAEYQIQQAMKNEPLLKVTLPVHADEGVVDKLVNDKMGSRGAKVQRDANGTETPSKKVKS